MKKILICGDSFSADWTVKYHGAGWPNMLVHDFDVTNLSQAGCSEYKIYQQLMSTDIDQFDAILISHTSPNRIYVKEHPVHKNDLLHKDACLIYTDIKEHASDNPSLQPIVDFYENYFDLDYAKFTHTLICEKINAILKGYRGRVIHITNMPQDDLSIFDNIVCFIDLMSKKYKGLMNHYSDEANAIIYNKIKLLLKDL